MSLRNLFLASIALALPAAGLHAQPWLRSSYMTSHSVGHTLPQANTAEVRVFTFRHARIASGGIVDEDHAPGAQNPAFDPMGFEFFTPISPAWNTGLFGSPVLVHYDAFTIPDTGSPNTPACTIARVGPSEAHACTYAQIDPFGPLPRPQPSLTITGEIGAYGFTNLVPPGSNAALGYAFSHTMISIRGGIEHANGTIQWDPTVYVDGIGGGVSSMVVGSFIRDPIIITATNLDTGEVVEHNLLHIDMSASGQGVIDMAPGVLTVDVPEFELVIDIPPGVIAPGQDGSFRLEVVGGVVQTSVGTGIYAPVAPAPGTGVPFDVAMPPIVLDYDLGLDPTFPWDVTAMLSGGGDTNDALPASCPADLAEPFGVLDLNDVNTFILGFAEQLPIADLNGDGVWDLQDVNMFINSFVSGCADGSD